MDRISFPHLGIVLEHVGRSFSVFGFEIAYYGVVIALAMLAGIAVATQTAKRTGQDPDQYWSFALIAILCSVAGARIYYVAFSWEYYGAHPMEIFDLRGGGLAIYGGVIAGVLTGICYAKAAHIPVLLLLDTACTGLITGQSIGRWGNFFNREAFGEYTDSLLAMELPVDAVNASDITAKMQTHMTKVSGIDCIRVHPTFLYESLWNLGVLAVLLFVTWKGKKRFDGQVFFLYLLGYGLGRAWIEGLRTDQLCIPGTAVAVSQVLSVCLVIGAVCALAAEALKNRKMHDQSR